MLLTMIIMAAISFGTLAIFYYWKSNFVFLSLPLAFCIDIAVFWYAFSYYEGRLPMILATIVQLGLQAMMAYYLKTAMRETK